MSDISCALENLRLEGDIDVEINQGTEAPEVAEEISENAEVAEEVSDAAGEAEVVDEKNEEVMRSFMILEHLYAHVKQYGVDRTFMKAVPLSAYLPSRNRLMSGYAPSAESLGATGDPYSAESVAVLEGIGDALRAVWQWLKNLASKIGSLMGRFFEVIRRTFGNVDANIGRLRKALKDRVFDAGKAKDAKAKIHTPKTMGAVISKFKSLAGAETAITDAKTVIAAAYDIVVKNGNSSISKADTEMELSKKVKEKLKDVKFETPEASEISLDTLKQSDIESLLSIAADGRRWLEQSKKQLDLAKTMSKQVEEMAKGAERRSGGDDNLKEGKMERKAAQAAGSVLSSLSSYMSKKTKVSMWVINQCIKSASVWISRCTKASS